MRVLYIALFVSHNTYLVHHDLIALLFDIWLLLSVINFKFYSDIRHIVAFLHLENKGKARLGDTGLGIVAENIADLVTSSAFHSPLA